MRNSIYPFVLRQLEINNPPILQRIFVCLGSCCVEHIASYVTEATRPKTDKKASKVGGLFVSSCLIISITLSSCSTVMDNLPGVYSLEIQQGNIVNQEMIDQLRPNMTKRQVLYIMGSSMLVDVFHQKRWDYLYSTQPGGEARRQKRLSLFFDGDKLIGVQGDFRPSTLAVIRKSNESTLELPKRNLDNTLWGKMTRLMNDESPTIPDEVSDDEQSSTLAIDSLDSEEKDEEVMLEDNITPEKESIESMATESIETNEALNQAVENKDISISPLPENHPQALEDIKAIPAQIEQTIEEALETEDTVSPMENDSAQEAEQVSDIEEELGN